MTAAASYAGDRHGPAVRRAGGGRLKPVVVRASLVLAALVPSVAEGGLWLSHPLTTVVNLLVGAGAVGAGALLAGDKEQRVTGYVLIAAGIARPLARADQWASGPGPLYSAVFGWSAIILFAWALLRYPMPSLDRVRRNYMVALAAWLIGMRAVRACLGRPEWFDQGNVNASTWWPYVWTDRGAFEIATKAQMVGSALLAIGFLVLMFRQVRLSGRRERAVRLPLFAAGALAAVAAGTAVVVTTIAGRHEEVLAIEGMAQLGVPIAFLVSFGQQRLTRLSRLVSVFDNTAPTARLLREVLRHDLHDSSLDLVVWSDADHGYLTVDGETADVQALSLSRRVIPVIGRSGASLALLIVDAEAASDPGLIDTAVAVSRLALENLLLSRRLLTADYDARQLIVADLHDGAQKDLCALRVALSKLKSADPEELPELLDAADRLVVGALGELRDLAHGVYPHTLTHAGLAAAIEETADGLDLIVHLTAPDHRLPATVERTIYFFVSEALTNAHKHAGVLHVDVSVRHAGSLIVAEVGDDGAGGADAESPGLSRLRDRIEAHGGRLNVSSPVGGGTHMVARVPCV